MAPRVDDRKYSIYDRVTDGLPVGLVQNPEGVPFQCGTCVFFKEGICNNPDSRLYESEVDAESMCCNKYFHPGMRVIVY